MATNQPEITVSAVDKTKAAFASVKAGMADIESSASRLANVKLGAALGASLSGAGIALLVRKTVDGLDALNDLKDATGASIENLSALEDVADRTGTRFESMASTLVKFNKVLSESKAGSETANVLKAIGLNAEELKRIDPAEALRLTAVALSRFADDGKKARIIQDLFGKSIQEAAPFLKDLAEQGKLNAKVTTEQAQAAEDFNKQLFKMQKNATDLARSFVGELLPAFNKGFEEFEKAGTSLEKLLVLLKATGFGSGLKLVGIDLFGKDQETQVANLKRSLEATNKLLNDGNVSEERRVRLLERRKLLETSLQAIDLPQASYSNEGRNARPSAGDIPDATKKLKDPELGYEQIARLQLEAEEQFQKDSAEAWDLYNKQIIGETKETADAWALMWKQIGEEYDANQERDIEKGQTFLDMKLEQMSDFAQEARRNIQDAFGDTLKRAMKGDFDDIGEMWKSLLIDMTAEALAAQLNKVLFGDGSNGSWGGLVGQAFKAVSGIGGADSSSGAGAVSDVGDYAMPDMVASAAGGSGRLSVSRAAAPSIVIHQTNNIGQGVSRGEVEAAVRAGNAKTQESIRRSMSQA